MSCSETSYSTKTVYFACLKYNLEHSKRTWDLKCFDMCFLLNTLLNKYVLIIKLQDHHFFEVIVSLSLLNKVTFTQSSASPSFWIIRNVVPRKSLLKAFFIKVHPWKNSSGFNAGMKHNNTFCYVLLCYVMHNT